MQDVPYDLIYDDTGKLIGEVYTLPASLTRRYMDDKRQAVNAVRSERSDMETG
ncbi:hypothetical protein [Paenibacillus sp. IITD108]|uniref:hypothetical protein n=1 Tax=Paenibacillus sp. IITD108 TaxID=3116649 RepID=UPI002F42980F